MSSSERSGRKARPATDAPNSRLVRARTQLLQHTTHSRTATDLLLDSIAECPDAVNASKLLKEAVNAERSPGEIVFPGAAWVLPPG